MPPLPVLSGKRVLEILQKAGFVVSRQRGSHVQLRHPDGRITTIPVHGNNDIPRGTLRGILHDMEISPEELSKLL